MAIRRAPASIAFSTSSLTTEAGRSTTSPAAIWLARSEGNRAILPTLDPLLSSEQREHEENDGDHDAKQPPELGGFSAREVRDWNVHPIQTREKGDRHEDRRHDREHLHDFVQPVADVGQVRVEDAADPVLKDGRVVGNPDNMVVDVPG